MEVVEAVEEAVRMWKWLSERGFRGGQVVRWWKWFRSGGGSGGKELEVVK